MSLTDTPPRRRVRGLLAALVGVAVLVAPTPAVAAAATFSQATAVRAADGGYRLDWTSGAAAVTVAATTDPAGTAGAVPLGTAAGTGTLTVPAGTLPASVRWYFRLTPDGADPLVVTDRSVGLPDASNFRDVGGYRTGDGRWVRMGVVFRSNKLSSLTGAEQQTVTAQHITLDVDLRNVMERHDDPDRVPAGVTYRVADVADLTHGISFHRSALLTLAEAIAAGLFGGSSDLGQSIGYPFMVDFTGADRAFRDLLTGIAANPNATVFHCSAGKDRTGWATAVLLTLLGVPRATVEADYLASDTYLGDPSAVQLGWLAAAYDEVDALYGDFDAYLHQGLGLSDATIAALRTRLLVA